MLFKKETILKFTMLAAACTALFWVPARTMAETANMQTGTSVHVIELFTSQSCSSCPPADRVFAELATEANIIALSCHVTYWDHLWWKDTLSQEFCTQRQRGYAAAHRRGVFTPEAIVNGRHSLNGADASALTRLMQNEAGVQKINIVKNENSYTATLPTGGGGLLLAFIGPDVTTQIKRGENGGRAIHYARPVMDIHTAGDIKTHIYTLKPSDIPAGMVGVAFLLQAGKNADSRIIAAGQVFF